MTTSCSDCERRRRAWRKKAEEAEAKRQTVRAAAIRTALSAADAAAALLEKASGRNRDR